MAVECYYRPGASFSDSFLQTEKLKAGENDDG